MFDKQVTALTAILKDKDIREYSGDAFWNIIKAVVLGDVGALLDATVGAIHESPAMNPSTANAVPLPITKGGN